MEKELVDIGLGSGKKTLDLSVTCQRWVTTSESGFAAFGGRLIVGILSLLMYFKHTQATYCNVDFLEDTIVGLIAVRL